jgi:hypothetical protein
VTAEWAARLRAAWDAVADAERARDELLREAYAAGVTLSEVAHCLQDSGPSGDTAQPRRTAA